MAAMLARRLSWFVNTVMFIPLPLLLPLEVCAATRDHVVLISIDGLAAFYLSDPQAPLPTLRRLAAATGG